MADGIATMPQGDPGLTIGWDVVAHAVEWLVQPNGPKAGQPWKPTPGQLHWLLWWYSVDAEGRWLFQHGIRRLAKGSGKSPFAAVLAIEELLGPVRLDLSRFDGTQESCHGKPVNMPLVQIAATAESQTANTMRMVSAMLAKRSRIVRHYGLDPGKTVVYHPAVSGKLEIITSSAHTAEGAEPTFVVEDETEHWTPGTGGQELAGTIKRNLAKSSSRAIETANAWEPGAGTVAESSYDAWVAQQEGRTTLGDSRFLYDARIAPAATDLHDDASVTAALAFVYQDCEWVDQRTIKDTMGDGQTTADTARRFFLNQPTSSDDAWVTPMQWETLRAVETVTDDGEIVPPRQIQDGEDVVLFFDGSKSRDATGLVGCAMSDGHIFTVGGWEPEPSKVESVVPVLEVDATVARAFDRWRVVGFFADVREWESFVKVKWPEEYADQLLIMAAPGGKEPQPIAWDMRSRTFDFTAATEMAHTEIIEQMFTHDGHSMLIRHVQNSRRRTNRYGTTIGKESKDSPKKIDLAVCVIGARMVRRLVLASDAWKKYQRRGDGGPNRIILL